MSDLAQALVVAIKVHAGQQDKQGEPYLLHILRVMEAVSDDAKVVAVLHDVMEDGGPEGKQLVLALELSEVEVVALTLLTRDRRCSYDSYIAAINCRPRDDIAREVKLADLRDNLGRIPPEPPVESLAESVEEMMAEEGHDEWLLNWSGLKRRYEKAIAVLEGE